MHVWIRMFMLLTFQIVGHIHRDTKCSSKIRPLGSGLTIFITDAGASSKPCVFPPMYCKTWNISVQSAKRYRKPSSSIVRGLPIAVHYCVTDSIKDLKKVTRNGRSLYRSSHADQTWHRLYICEGSAGSIRHRQWICIPQLCQRENRYFDITAKLPPC